MVKIKHVEVTLGSISVPEVGGGVEYFPVDEDGTRQARHLAQSSNLGPQEKWRIVNFAAAIQQLIEPESVDYGQGPVKLDTTIRRIDPHGHDRFTVLYYPMPSNPNERVDKQFDAANLEPPLPLLWRNIMVDLRSLCWEDLQSRIYGTVVPPPERQMPVVFISYRREYDEFAEPLAKQLAVRGLEVFKDNWVFKSGDRFHSEIDEYLERCDHFIATISPGYKESPECAREYERAAERWEEFHRPRLHPVYWKSNYQSIDVPPGWEDIHGIRFGGDKIDFIEKVSELLEGIWEIDTHPFHV